MPQSPPPTPMPRTRNMILEGIEKVKIGNEVITIWTQKSYLTEN